MKRARLVALGLAVVLVPGCSLTPSLVAIPRVGPLDIKGDVLVSSSGSSVSSDAEELGLEEDSGVFEPRVDFEWGPAHIMASAYWAEYEGTGTAESDLDLGGVVISEGEQVESSLDIASVNVLGTFDLIPTDVVDLGLGLGVRVIDFDGKVTSLSTGDSIESAEGFALPVAAARAALSVGPFELSLLGSGITGSYDDMDASVIDLDLMGEYTFEKLLGFRGSLILGYRYITIDVEYTDEGSDVEAELDFSGPYVGLALGI